MILLEFHLSFSQVQSYSMSISYIRPRLIVCREFSRKDVACQKRPHKSPPRYMTRMFDSSSLSILHIPSRYRYHICVRLNYVGRRRSMLGDCSDHSNDTSLFMATMVMHAQVQAVLTMCCRLLAASVTNSLRVANRSRAVAYYPHYEAGNRSAIERTNCEQAYYNHDYT